MGRHARTPTLQVVLEAVGAERQPLLESVLDAAPVADQRRPRRPRLRVDPGRSDPASNADTSGVAARTYDSWSRSIPSKRLASTAANVPRCAPGPGRKT